MIHLILNDKTFVVKYMLRVEMRNPWKFLPWLVFKYLQGKSMLETKYEGIRPCSSYLIFHTAEQKRTFQNFYLRFVEGRKEERKEGRILTINCKNCCVLS